MGDRDDLNAPVKKHAEPIIQNPALANIHSRDMRVVDIKLLHMRPTAGVGAGSILPFSIRDVRDTIDPEKRVAARTTTTTTTTTSSSSTTPTSTITCADGTQFPTAGTYTNSILFNLPPTSGSCSLSLGPTAGANSVFVLNTFTSVSAAISGVNGWSVNASTLNSGVAAPASNTIQVSKAGVTYSLVISISNNVAGGGNVIISSFTRL